MFLFKLQAVKDPGDLGQVCITACNLVNPDANSNQKTLVKKMHKLYLNPSTFLA